MIRLRRQADVKPTPLFWVALIASLLGCQRHYPEGGYSCSLPQRPGDCPPSWYCHADLHCYSGPEDASVDVDAARIDANGGSDAGTLIDAWAVDAWTAVDAGGARDVAVDAPACPAEMCDAIDNDCDGRVDEGLATVGSPIPIGTGTMREGFELAALPNGFGILDLPALFPQVNGAAPTWTVLSFSGAPATSRSLGSDVVARWMSARSDGASVFAAIGAGHFAGVLDFVALPNAAFTFDPANAARIAPATGGPATVTEPSRAYPPIVSDAAGGRATTFLMYGDASPHTVRRHRLAASGGTFSVLSSNDVMPAVSFSALRVGAHDVVVALTASGLSVGRMDAGDAATTVTVLGPVGGLPTVASIGTAVMDASAEVSAANPIGVALLRNAPDGIVFVQIESLSPLVLGTPINLPGAIGSGSFDLVAASTATSGGHFFVTAMDTSAAGASTRTLRVWEVTGEPPVARAITIVDDWTSSRYGMSVARSGDSVRLAELDNLGNVVTRSIGCR